MNSSGTSNVKTLINNPDNNSEVCSRCPIPEYMLTFLNNAHCFIPIPWVEGLHSGTQVAFGLNTQVRTSWSHNSQGLHARS